ERLRRRRVVIRSQLVVHGERATLGRFRERACYARLHASDEPGGRARMTCDSAELSDLRVGVVEVPRRRLQEYANLQLLQAGAGAARSSNAHAATTVANRR